MARSPTSIRTQMLIAIGSIVLAVMAVLVFVTLFVAQHQLYALGERDIRDRVEAIASRSGFAAIVGADNPAIAQQIATESTGTNGVLATELTGADGRRIAALEDPAGALALCAFLPGATSEGVTTITRRLSTQWCVSAPILKRTAAGLCTNADCIEGRLHVVASTSAVSDVVRRLIIAILFMGSVLLAFALFFLWKVAALISSPLQDLVGVMRRFAGGDRAARATERGPVEALTISRVYNTLIDAQETQARTLETTVAERTAQLSDAVAKLNEAQQYKTIFMGHIAHNMRTPLHVIRTQATEMLNEMAYGADTDQLRRHIDLIVHRVNELLYRSDQVLDLTRGDTGHLVVNLGPMSLEHLRAELLDKAEALAKPGHNKLIFECDSDTIWTDADKVLQIATNLIENACKATSDGTIMVSLTVRHGILRIAVSDDGIGIPADQLVLIWGEFRQAEVKDGRRTPGFGLGLALVRQYATILGGRYDAASEVGQGATVWVEIPVRAALIPQERTI